MSGETIYLLSPQVIDCPSLFFFYITLSSTEHARRLKMRIHHLICLFLPRSSFHVSLATTSSKGIPQSQAQQHSRAKINPFTPKASLIRYWNTHISNQLPIPIPHFLLSKASPLTGQHYAILNNFLTRKPFSPQFHHSLCSTPNLYCSFDEDTLHHPTTTATCD